MAVAVPATRTRAHWWLVPLVIVAVGGLVWLLLAGMPFGQSDRPPAPAAARDETIAKGRVERGTATIVEAPEVKTKSAPARAKTITEGEAIATLRPVAARYYDISNDCLSIASGGYRNAGYTLEVGDSCESRTLGRWRVDAKTREVFRQREDGRYLRP